MCMKRSIIWFFLVLAAVTSVLGIAVNRTALRERWEQSQKPSLPAAEPFSATATVAASSTVPKPVKQPVATGTTLAADPLAWTGSLPTSTNLSIPFLSQAPKMDWSAPYQEACEEASALMVDAYFDGRTQKFTANEGDKAVVDLTTYTIDRFGGREDTSAKETAAFIKAYFGYKTVLVRDVTEPNDIKRALANRYPVIVPAYGKALGNPNFHNGGPVYHMLVIKGYLPDGRWITNDPGTRKGADYVYDQKTLMNALHDWNGGDVSHGKPVMIVVLPR